MYEIEGTTPLQLLHRIEYPRTSRTPALITAAAVMLVFGAIAAGMMQANPATKPAMPAAIQPAVETASPSPLAQDADASKTGQVDAAPPLAAMTPVDHGALDREVMASAATAAAASGAKLILTHAADAARGIPAQDRAGAAAPESPAATPSGVAGPTLHDETGRREE